MNYYEEIKDLIEKKEVTDGVRRLSYNSDKLKTYYEIGKILVEAQVEENKTKYKDMLIKKKYHNKSIGLIISKKNDNFIFSYVNDEEFIKLAMI